MSAPFHPDQLVPGSEVGPWRVVASLGAGGFGRVFKVERGGRFFTMKMALRPAGSQVSEEEDVNGRLSHEVAALLACAPHPNLPRLHAVDRWPEPPEGYLFFVTDFIDGETFHEWRWRVKPSAAHLLSVFTEVVRAVSDLHRRGLHHRDLKGDNLLIRRDDERPFLIDLGTVRMPGATTLTVGVAPASPHLLPPECVAFLREGLWEQGARFDAGIPGDLYALGALLYEALTDGYAFDPRLPYDRLLPAIETVTPRAPHLVNPKVPPALGDLALRLLAKRPEDRYPNTEALLQALWEVAKEKRQPAWRLSLDLPPEPESPRDVDSNTPRVRMVPELVRTPEPSASDAEQDSDAENTPSHPLAPEAVAAPADALPTSPPPPPAPTPPPREPSWTRGVAVGVLVLFVLGAVALGVSRRESPASSSTQAVAPLPPPAEKGSPVVTSRPLTPPDTARPSSPSAEPAEAPTRWASVTPPPSDEPSRESTPTRKRGSVSGTLGKTAAVACLAGACAGSSPQTRMTSPEAECPPGSVERLLALKFEPGMPLAKDSAALVDLATIERWTGEMPLPPEGPVTVYVFRNFPLRYQAKVFPPRTKFHGRLFHGQSRYYVWLTEAETPDGNRTEVCFQVGFQDDREPVTLGMQYLKSSTPERKLINPLVEIYIASHLGRP
ncbi:protein kinase [Myxococcus sp. K38C18041901]|uniref:serine/threonine protein kinase n=1 Tax=Myxococcus guangdongensis TaxID=2906760 RepID=UPI0020A72F3C|nr:serine/threonine protein kinase [Myxococcus guangdongensis]MCP3060488.1 protein kinase [Myxococcus guangdongensis]